MERIANQTVLVLGATGMLGHTLFRCLSRDAALRVFGTVRSERFVGGLAANLRGNIIEGIDAENTDHVLKAIADAQPSVVVNCIGVVKQLDVANDPLVAIPINSILPHRLARICETLSARLIHISTDCVFDGSKGGYVETDPADALDLYGRSKHMGEVDYPNAITLRTSIIGPEIGKPSGLLGWFLNSHGRVKGYTKAVFSGLTTLELSETIRREVLPRPQMHGVYHVASDAISKDRLLRLIAEIYKKDIEIVAAAEPVIDRSLNADRFFAATGYRPDSWPSLIERMHAFG